VHLLWVGMRASLLLEGFGQLHFKQQ